MTSSTIFDGRSESRRRRRGGGGARGRSCGRGRGGRSRRRGGGGTAPRHATSPRTARARRGYRARARRPCRSPSPGRSDRRRPTGSGFGRARHVADHQRLDVDDVRVAVGLHRHDERDAAATCRARRACRRCARRPRGLRACTSGRSVCMPSEVSSDFSSLYFSATVVLTALNMRELVALVVRRLRAGQLFRGRTARAERERQRSAIARRHEVRVPHGASRITERAARARPWGVSPSAAYWLRRRRIA